MRSSHSMDLTKGSVSKKLILFAMPILLSSLLQHFYTMADRVVVGHFAENKEVALAAVSSTGSATTLLLNLFLGIAIGANVVCSNYRGARMTADLRKAMHTSLVMGAIFGVIMSVVGVVLAPYILEMMGAADDVIADATLYMRIYFLGVPASLIYNFGAAILRAHGDTKRPMYILALTGLVNVGLNMLLVMAFHLDVAGVAIATIAAQYLSAITVLVILFSPKDEYGLAIKELRLYKEQVKRMITIGVPCGINGMVFSVSNVIVQSSVNSFNDVAIIAGSGAAADLTGYPYLIPAAFTSACISFSGQCYGAKLYKRVDRLLGASILWCTVSVCLVSIVVTLFPDQLLSIYNDNPDVIAAGRNKMIMISWGYILFGISDIFLGCLRGMGHSTVPTTMNLLGICVPRLLWVFFVFPHHRTILFLFICYPISWLISAILQSSYFFYCRRKLYKKVQESQVKT